MSRRLALLAIAALSVPLIAAAQEPPSSTQAAPDAPGCVLHPAPECRDFGITEFGLAFGSARESASPFDTPDTRQELFIEGGVMRNIDPHNAVGVTWFFALDNEAASTVRVHGTVADSQDSNPLTWVWAFRSPVATTRGAPSLD